MPEPEELVLTCPTAVTGREDHDFYPTPFWVTQTLVEYAEQQRWWQRGERVFDPACGEGALLDVLKHAGLVTLGIELDAARAKEARRRGHVALCGDGLGIFDQHAEYGFDLFPLVVMNPPFSLAESFVRKAMEHRPARGLVIALLRLSWLEPAGTRGELLRATTPDVLILPKRPIYDGRGHDSVTSAWFCFPGTRHYEHLPLPSGASL